MVWFSGHWLNLPNSSIEFVSGKLPHNILLLMHVAVKLIKIHKVLPLNFSSLERGGLLSVAGNWNQLASFATACLTFTSRMGWVCVIQSTQSRLTQYFHRALPSLSMIVTYPMIFVAGCKFRHYDLLDCPWQQESSTLSQLTCFIMIS